MIAENREDWNSKRAAGIGQHGCLLGFAVRCQIAAQQHHLRRTGKLPQPSDEGLPAFVAAVQISGGGDTELAGLGRAPLRTPVVAV
jgi:hypothetical protein